MKIILIFLFFSVVLCMICFAQKNTQTLRGIILDAQTGEPLPYATIFIPKTGNGTTSDIEGNFLLGNIDIGRYNIQFGFVGY